MNNKIELSVANLAKETYARSQKWAEFMNRLSSVVEETEIHVDTLDKGLEEAEEDEDDSLSNMESEEEEEQEELDLLQEIKTSFLHNIFNKNETITAQLSKSAAFNNSNRQEVNAIQNFLDATLPVVEENNRIWKDSGMDNVLSTFDLKKIQQEVGGWLHSNNKRITFPDCKNLSPIPKSPSRQNSETSSEDSMHSVDTARYIRTSRKYRKIGKISPYNTMNIKTYRLVKSKRDALREKYAYLEKEDLLEFDRHCQGKSSLCRSNSKRRHFIEEPTKSLIYTKKYPMTEVRRKKRCRKMHTMADAIDTSDDEDVVHCRKQQQSFKQHRLYGSLKKKYVPYLNAHSMCACAACVTHCTPVISTVPRPYRYGYAQERLAVKRESECGCCNEDTLCEDTIHLADTSTEKWVVENLYTPTKHKHQHKLKKLVKKSRRSRQLNPYDNLSGIQPLSSTVLSTKSIQFLNGPRPNSIEYTEIKEHDTEPIINNENAQNNNEQLNLDSKKVLQKKPHANNDDVQATLKVSSKFLKSKKLKKQKEEDVLSETDEKNNLKENAEKAMVLRSKKISKTEVKPMSLSTKKSSKTEVEEQKQLKIKKSNKLEKPKAKYVQPIPVVEPEQTKSLKRVKSSKKKKNVTKKEHKANKQDIKCKEKKNQKTKVECSEKIVKPQNLSTIYEQIDSTNESCKKIEHDVEKEEQTKHISSVCDTTNGNDAVILDSFVGSEDIKTTTTEQVSSCKNENDCTVVTSTTNNSQQKILIYNPEDRETIPKECLVDDGFILTNEHLSSILGERPASKFLKYYLGKRKFDVNSIIYFCPPKAPQYDDTESDDDELECFGKHGHLQF